MTLKILSGAHKGRALKTPKGPSTRPTQGMLRAAIFNICQNIIENARFLDLFAGSGAMGLEAYSRGAAHVTLVENHPAAISCIRENIETLQAKDTCHLLPLEVHLALKKLQGPFDIVYIDPPYDSPAPLLFEGLLTHNLLAPNATLFIEERFSSKNPPPSLPKLFLHSERRFGSARLLQYQVA